MKKKWKEIQFGWVLKKLRSDVGLTQKGADELLIQVEGGVLKDRPGRRISAWETVGGNLPSLDMLVLLADVYKLTPRRRNTLIDFAMEIKKPSGAAFQYFEPDEGYEHCLEVLRTTEHPAFIIDQFFDIIACNNALVEVLRLKEFDPPISEWIEQKFPVNLFDVYFRNTDKGTIQKREKIIEQEILRFYDHSFLYCYWPYLSDLLVRLRKDEGFPEEWETIAESENDPTRPIQYEMDNPDYQPASSTQTDTAKKLEKASLPLMIGGVLVGSVFVPVGMVAIVAGWVAAFTSHFLPKNEEEEKYGHRAEFISTSQIFRTTEGILDVISLVPEDEKTADWFRDLHKEPIITASQPKRHPTDEELEKYLRPVKGKS